MGLGFGLRGERGTVALAVRVAPVGHEFAPLFQHDGVLRGRGIFEDCGCGKLDPFWGVHFGGLGDCGTTKRAADSLHGHRAGHQIGHRFVVLW